MNSRFETDEKCILCNLPSGDVLIDGVCSACAEDQQLELAVSKMANVRKMTSEGFKPRHLTPMVELQPGKVWEFTAMWWARFDGIVRKTFHATETVAEGIVIELAVKHGMCSAHSENGPCIQTAVAK